MDLPHQFSMLSSSLPRSHTTTVNSSTAAGRDFSGREDRIPRSVVWMESGTDPVWSAKVKFTFEQISLSDLELSVNMK